MSLGDAQADISDLMSWSPPPITAELITGAWMVENRFGLQFWAALMFAATQQPVCRHLLTDDLQDDQDLDGVLGVNPFARQPEDILTS